MRRGLVWAPLVLLVTAAVELAVFLVAVEVLGAGWAVLSAALVSLVGLLLLRREGMRAWRRFRAAAQRDEPPGEQVTDGVVGLAGALLLAVPGFVTGLLGLFLVTPPVRQVARRGVRRAAERRVSSALAGDLFGPRRVRVRRGAGTDPGPVPPVQPTDPVDVVEGEIVDVRPRVGG